MIRWIFRQGLWFLVRRLLCAADPPERQRSAGVSVGQVAFVLFWYVGQSCRCSTVIVNVPQGDVVSPAVCKRCPSLQRPVLRCTITTWSSQDSWQVVLAVVAGLSLQPYLLLVRHVDPSVGQIEETSLLYVRWTGGRDGGQIGAKLVGTGGGQLGGSRKHPYHVGFVLEGWLISITFTFQRMSSCYNGLYCHNKVSCSYNAWYTFFRCKSSVNLLCSSLMFSWVYV